MKIFRKCINIFRSCRTESIYVDLCQKYWRRIKRNLYHVQKTIYILVQFLKGYKLVHSLSFYLFFESYNISRLAIPWNSEILSGSTWTIHLFSHKRPRRADYDRYAGNKFSFMANLWQEWEANDKIDWCDKWDIAYMWRSSIGFDKKEKTQWQNKGKWGALIWSAL